MSFKFTNNFARILAKENIIIRRSVKATTASFNMKTRLLILPVWEGISEKLHDMILVHEVGHALDTPLEPLVKAIKFLSAKYKTNVVKDYINVVEDARIDRNQKVRYPGTIVDYALGYKELYTRDFFQIKSVKNINSFPLIDRINLLFKNGHHLGLKFSPAEQVIIDRVAATETFDDVVDVVDTILSFTQADRALSEMLNSLFSEGGSEEGSEGGSNEGSNGGSEGGSEGGDYDKLKSKLKKSKNKNAPISKSLTSESLVETLASFKTKATEEPVIVNTGLSNPRSIVVPYKKLLKSTAVSDEFIRWRNNEKPNVSYMVSEFERKKAADINKRVRVDKTGVLDMSDIYKYKYSDDIFKRQDIIPEGKNHGLIFLLDWSGSMRQIIHDTLKQLLVLTMFCRMTSIPFDVYIFQTSAGMILDKLSVKDILTDDDSKDMAFSGFTLKNILSSKMTANEYLRMSSYFFEMTRKTVTHHGEWTMGGTPLIGSLEVLPEVVNSFIAHHKVQVPSVFVLTDGDSDTPSIYFDNSHGRTITINNVKTKKSYTAHYNARDMVGAMVENLKDATGSRVIGIHLLGARDAINRYGKTVDPDKGYVITSERGYDKHYAVLTKNMTMVNRNDFWNRYDKILSGDQLGEALADFGKKKSYTRFLLRSFIDDISLDRNK